MQTKLPLFTAQSQHLVPTYAITLSPIKLAKTADKLNNYTSGSQYNKLCDHLLCTTDHLL